MSFAVPYRHLWSPERLSSFDLHVLLDTAETLKQSKQRHRGWGPLRGRHVALLCSGRSEAAQAFDRAVTELGGTAALLDADDWRARAGDKVPEAARMLGRLYDAIDCCDLPAPLVEQIEAHCSVPVFNGLAQSEHPLRVLGELLTMRETGNKPLNRLRLQVAGHDKPSAQAATLARLAGVDVQAQAAHSMPDGAAHAAASANDADFILNESTPNARLTRPDASPAEQAHLSGLLVENRQCTLQALLVCGIQ